MRQTVARDSGLRAALRRRWWVLPIVLAMVAAGLALRALTAPLSVSASVADGDHAVVRSSAVVLTFNQDMDVASVKSGFRITPPVPYQVVVINPHRFEQRRLGFVVDALAHVNDATQVLRFGQIGLARIDVVELL